MGVALGLAFGTELRGAPAVLRVDNGPEFMSEQLHRSDCEMRLILPHPSAAPSLYRTALVIRAMRSHRARPFLPGHATSDLSTRIVRTKRSVCRRLRRLRVPNPNAQRRVRAWAS